MENTASFLLEKCFQTNLELGFNIKDEGLVWILKRIGLPSSYDHFPRFLNSNEKNFLVEVPVVLCRNIPIGSERKPFSKREKL